MRIAVDRLAFLAQKPDASVGRIMDKVVAAVYPFDYIRSVTD